MNSELENNGEGPPDEHADLKLMFRDSTPSFARVDIDALLNEATQNPSAAVANVGPREPLTQGEPKRAASNSSAVSQSRRRIIMLSKVGALGVCAAGICLALVFGLGGGNTVLAQVQGALKKVKTVSYTGTQTISDQPDQIWKVKLLGENLCRVEQPNGIYVIFDVKGRKIMEVNPGESKVRITENLPVPKDFNILAKLTNLNDSAAKVQPGVPNREIGGIVAAGFVIEEDNGAHYNVWVDPKTNLPLEMEGERKFPIPDGKGGFKEQIVKERWTDFRFDVPIDDSLFAMNVPKGFAVETLQAPEGNGAARDQQNRAEEQLKAAKEAAKKKAE